NVARYPNVRVIPGAIGAKSGSVALSNPKGESDAVRTTRAENGGTPVYSVADLKALAGSDAELFLMKVDIEGFESDLFSANTEWIGATSIIVVEPHDWMLPGEHSSRSMQK